MTNDPIKDSEISALYREGAKAEPPPVLDAAIRAAAHEALTERPAAALRPQPWWERWRLPVGVFATLVLTFSLTLLVERERARDIEPAPPAVPAPARVDEPAAEKSPPAVADEAQPQRVAPPPQKSAPAIRRDALPQRSRSAEAAAPAATAPEPISPPVLGGAAAPAAAEQRSSVETLQARPAAEGAMADRVAPAAVQMKREAKAAAPAARSPEAWLEEIRRLRREGRAAEAQAQLEEFRRAHPDFVLPDDLKR
ncbi:hypothetical protein [Sulfurisoma sediminicola]|uniref:Uncharacterized protein n=1 Tax=Sulfurisoma sediminicola TaxID=1381557 RepID=A0A497XDR1_9PROT|nr:hypothetical protein [Sulfurisoma sediminicola]RLJ64839.1 hypothetical protein DFR35_1487 [Sulfurisoma sediminicola]